MQKHTKYKGYPIFKLENRKWCDKIPYKAPIWASTDLRDGNQALANPMDVEQKIAYFKLLLFMGFKEIEVAYPSASETEFTFCRRLIEEGHIPNDVAIGVLTPSIERHIKRSFEALQGAKKIIMHLYNPTAANQCEVVFKRTKKEIIALALEGVETIKAYAKAFAGEVTLEYSPESFSQTEIEFALEISNAVIDAWQPTPRHKMILNLPNTLEACMPNVYADRIEWMAERICRRESVILSVHPHNDRGCAVASAECAMLAGAERVEGTLLGNGERAGNVDLVTLAFNLYSQGIDPQLHLESIDEILKNISALTNIAIPPRHPYVGAMIYTAFSGTHQDAIKKGIERHRERGSRSWEVPYLPIDPQDIKREYKDIVRINSQSGKSGIFYLLKEHFGIEVRKAMRQELIEAVQKGSEAKGGELNANEIFEIYATIKKNKKGSRWMP